MKWFKHQSNSSRDPFMQELFDEFRHEGPACWWFLLETVADNMSEKSDTTLEITLKNLARNLRISTTKAHKFITFCSQSSKVLSTFSGKKVIIEVPKLLEIRDKYSNDLQVTGKRLTLDKNRRDKKRTDKSNGNERFDLFWTAYPKKVAKKYARKAWDKLDITDSLQTSILAAIELQKGTEAWQKDGGQFIPHPATWLNGGNWENEVGGNGKPHRTPEELEWIEAAKKVRERHALR